MTTTATKWVYRFSEGSAQMRDLLGGKGAGLCEMSRAGLPVPPGFVITTEACRAYSERGGQLPEGLWASVQEHLGEVEAALGRSFGGTTKPLLISVRSGAKFSMPGMMDTVLNLGLNDDTVAALAAETGSERFALDAYRRFIQLFGKVVLRIDGTKFEKLLEAAKETAGVHSDAELAAADLRALVDQYRDLVVAETSEPFPGDPWVQLERAVRAVFESWNSRRAVDYRNYNKIPHDLGTAVNIVAMVFGNLGDDSGTGVLFTRNPSTGEREIFGEYLQNAQGEDVVAGTRTPQKIAQLAETMPEVYRQLEGLARQLETHYRDAQDIEFTVERGRLFILQTRAAKRTPAASVRVAVDLAREGMIDEVTALQRVSPDEVSALLLPAFDAAARTDAIGAGRLLGRGLNASPGAATGRIIFDADRAAERAAAGEVVILARPETNPDDVHGILIAQGVLTSRGGMTSHAAVVTRGLGKACIVGMEPLRIDLDSRTATIDGRTIAEGDEVSLDGTTGEVFLGRIQTVEPDLAANHELFALLGWADGVRTLGVRANADYPRDAAQAREYGAQGIGLCRTEHMFFETERLAHVHEMLVNAPEHARLKAAVDAATEGPSGELARAQEALQGSQAAHRYLAALAKLEDFQRQDFTGILDVMRGYPVVIRLLDMPLHEFLPSHDELLAEVAVLEATGADPEKRRQQETMLSLVNVLREANPMLGHRGCRLGVSFPEVYEMQVRAIMTAAADLVKQGIDARPEIMIPLVSHVNELRALKPRLEEVAAQTLATAGVDVHYTIGTMIETPRAALTAGDVATEAQFFSFGSNDLTQMTFGYSRDDAEGKFLGEYTERKILPANPFQTIDVDGVGRLIRLATTEGRQARGDLTVGICGEHGGDPATIAFCQAAGLDYVSCSPFRIPVARLAAAQAVLGQRERDR